MTPACVWLFFPVCPLLCTYAKWPFGLVSEKTAVHYNYVYPPTWPSPTHLHYSSTHTIHIHAHTRLHTRMHTYSHTHAHTHACMHACTHTHTHILLSTGAGSIYYCVLCRPPQYGWHQWTLYVWLLAHTTLPWGPGPQHGSCTLGTQWMHYSQEDEHVTCWNSPYSYSLVGMVIVTICCTLISHPLSTPFLWPCFFLVLCPNSNPLMRKGSGDTSPNSWAYESAEAV